MIIKNIINNIGSSFLKLDKKFIYGFNGELLWRHQEKLWFNKCITLPAYNVTYLRTSDKIHDTLNDIKTFKIMNKPLGIGVVEESKSSWNHDIIDQQPKPLSHKTGKVTIITDSSDGKNLYHKLQRERKIWWRKLSTEPSRFKLTEAKKIKTTTDSVEIRAHFPFGSILVETINYQQEPRKFFSKIEAPYPECQIVEYETSFDWGCLSFICDAYTKLDDEKFQLKFHPKLAPYKVGICIEKNSDNDDKFNEKLKLLKYLNNKLKQESIETITTNDNEQLEYLHVPIIVKIDDSSFDNGIVKVWSQSTTICELVHLSELTRHVITRCN